MVRFALVTRKEWELSEFQAMGEGKKQFLSKETVG
jgi:hypothetical protein